MSRYTDNNVLLHIFHNNIFLYWGCYKYYGLKKGIRERFIELSLHCKITWTIKSCFRKRRLIVYSASVYFMKEKTSKGPGNMREWIAKAITTDFD